MGVARVSIYYRPRLYRELFIRIFESLGSIEIVDIPFRAEVGSEKEDLGDEKIVDVVVLPLNPSGLPEVDLLPGPQPDAKLLAFSPEGDHGFRRLPGKNEWEEVRPFGLDRLMSEVLGAN